MDPFIFVAEDQGSGEPKPLPDPTITSESAGSSNGNVAANAGSSNDIFSNLSEDQLGDFPYSEYTVDESYERWGGILQVPVAIADGPGETVPCELIRTSCSYGAKVVKWKAQRIGKAPEDYAIDQKLVLSYSKVTPMSPVGDGRGFLIFAKEGLYVYRLETPTPINPQSMLIPEIPIYKTV